MVLVAALALGGCAEILSALGAAVLTAWTTNKDQCVVQEVTSEGKTTRTRFCFEGSVLPASVREWLAPMPAPPPSPSTPTSAGGSR